MTTQQWTQARILALLQTSDLAVERALLRLYSFQTEEERQSRTTQKRNRLGFNSHDARFYSMLAERIQRGQHLSPRLLALLRKPKGISKYWKQLLQVANQQIAA